MYISKRDVKIALDMARASGEFTWRELIVVRDFLNLLQEASFAEIGTAKEAEHEALRVAKQGRKVPIKKSGNRIGKAVLEVESHLAGGSRQRVTLPE